MTEDDIPKIVGLVGNRATKWKPICGQCGVLPGDIDIIAKNPLHLISEYQVECFTAGLKKWCSIDAKKAMFSVLIKALRSQVVGEGVLAHELIEKRFELPSATASIKVKQEDGKRKGTV